MKGTAQDGTIEWIEWDSKNPETPEDGWRVHVPFLMSSWECLFGRGCPGHFGIQQSTIQTDIGCCTHGAWFMEREDYEHIREMTSKLTDEDWDSEMRSYVETQGGDPLIVYKAVNEESHTEDGETVIDVEESYNGKTRVFEGGCVFANRHDGSVGSTGKTGCAFVHYGMRNGLSHVDTMPNVCWQLPLRVVQDEEQNVNVLIPWDSDEWGPADDEEVGTHDSWMRWWCIDTPDAYVYHPGGTPVYKNMEAELRKTMGDADYAHMVLQLQRRELEYGWDTNFPQMPALVKNEGRPLIPLLVGNRKDRRTPQAPAQIDPATQTPA